MRAGAATGDVGCVHAAAIYDSADGLLRAVVPPLRAAIDAGQPALACLPVADASLVREAMGGGDGVTFLPVLEPDARPAEFLKRICALVGHLVADGAEQARLVTTIPHAGMGATGDRWSRFEAALNELLDDLPLSALCLYDRRITPRAVLADIERTHPCLVGTDGEHVANAGYQDPAAFVRSMSPPPTDPLEAEPPAAELVEPSPGEGRRAVQQLADRTHLARAEVDDLVLATSEVVTNALKYGRPPVTLRLWVEEQRMVVTVADRGAGPADPFVGLVPQARARAGNGGLGLWLVNQLVAVSYTQEPHGFTVHLVAGSAMTSPRRDVNS